MNERQIREILISEVEERLFNSEDYVSPLFTILDKKNIYLKKVIYFDSIEVKYIDENKSIEMTRKYEKFTHHEIAEKVFNEFLVPNSVLEINYSPYLKMLLIIMGYFFEEDACIHHYEIVNDLLSSGLSKYAIESRKLFLNMYTKEKIR